METRNLFEQRAEAAQKAASKIREYYLLRFGVDLPEKLNGFPIAHTLLELFDKDEPYQWVYDYSSEMENLLLFLKEIKSTPLYQEHNLGEADKYVYKLFKFFEALRLEESSLIELEYYDMQYNFGDAKVENIQAVEREYDIKIKTYHYAESLKNESEKQRRA